MSNLQWLSSTVTVVLFIMLCKVVLIDECADEILECVYSNESYWALLSCGTAYCSSHSGSMTFLLYTVVLAFYSFNALCYPKGPQGRPWWVLVSAFLWCRLLCKVPPAFQSVDKILKVWPFKCHLLSSTFPWCCLSCWARWLYMLFFDKSLSYLKTPLIGEPYFNGPPRRSS